MRRFKIRQYLQCILVTIMIFITMTQPYIWMIRVTMDNGQRIEHITKYTFIDMTPFGSALFFPMLVVLLLCILFVLSLRNIFSSGKKYWRTQRILVGSALVCLTLPILLNMAAFNNGILLLIILLFILEFLIVSDKSIIQSSND